MGVISHGNEVMTRFHFLETVYTHPLFLSPLILRYFKFKIQLKHVGAVIEKVPSFIK